MKGTPKSKKEDLHGDEVMKGTPKSKKEDLHGDEGSWKGHLSRRKWPPSLLSLDIHRKKKNVNEIEKKEAHREKERLAREEERERREQELCERECERKRERKQKDQNTNVNLPNVVAHGGTEVKVVAKTKSTTPTQEYFTMSSYFSTTS